MKKGFTLVELSIVLVIIGLLIGGLLVGQSLIESARFNRFIGQVSQYDSAISTFRAKYKSWPGDTPLFPNPGNGDGILEDNGNPLEFGGEIANFFYHLSLGISLKNEKGENFTPVDSYSQDEFAFTALKPLTQKGKDFALYAHADSAIIGDGKPALYLAWYPPTSFNFFPLLPKHAVIIDQKMDDGNAWYGKVRNAGPFNLSNTGCNNGSTGAYNVNGTTYNCTPYFQLGIATGDR